MFRNSFGSQTFVVCLFFIIVPDSTVCHIRLRGKSLMDCVSLLVHTVASPVLRKCLQSIVLWKQFPRACIRVAVSWSKDKR